MSNIFKGIFASEIQKMIIPNKIAGTSDPIRLKTRLKMVSLSNYLTESADYKIKHSAFRINVRQRQPLAAVNVKLMEQKRSTTSIGNPANLDEHVVDNQTAPAQTAPARPTQASDYDEVEDEDAAYTDEYLLNRDMFRPSLVRKRNKITISIEGGPDVFSRLTMRQSESRAQKSSLSKRSITSGVSNSEKKQYYNENQYESQAKSSAGLKHSSLSRKDTDLKLDMNDDSEHLKDTSETTIYSSLNNKSNKSANLYDDLVNHNHNEFIKGLHSQTGSIETPSTPGSIQFKRMQFYRTNLDLNQNMLKYKHIMDNLGEEEFIKFLKLYRETKSIGSMKSTSKSNFSVTNLTVDSAVNNQDQPGVSKFVNMQTQCLSLQNRESSKRMPSFFVNYVNNKLHVKTHDVKNLVGDKTDNLNNTFYPSATLKNFANNITNQTSNQPKNHAFKIKAEQRFRPMKILNFPAFG